MIQDFFGSKPILIKEFWARKKIWTKKFFGPKNLFWTKVILDQKSFLVKKSFKIFWDTKIFKNLGLNKIFNVKILTPKGPDNFYPKNLAPQNYAQHQENFPAPKKLFDPTNCLAHVSFNLVRHIDKS